MSASSRRVLAATATSALLLCLTTACGSSGSDTSSGGTVTLRYAIWDAVQEPALQKSVAVFEKQHPKIKVKIELNAWAQYWSKLQTQMAGRTAPDVFWDHVAYFPQFSQQNVLADLTPYIKADKLDTSIYDPKLLTGWQQDGKQYGLPKDWDTIAQVYNKTMLEKAGLTQDELGGLSWNTTDGGSFVKALQKLTVDDNGKHPNEPGFDSKHVKQYGLALGSANGQTDWWDAAVQNGCKLQDKAWGKWTINQPSCVKAIQFVQDLRLKYHVAVPASVTNTPNGASLPQVMARKQAAVVWDGSWDLNAYQSSMKGNFGVAELPSGPAGKGTVYNGLSNALYAGSKHPKEAWELVKWLGSQESQKIIVSQGSVWPGIPTLNKDYVAVWQKRGVDVSAFSKEAEGTTVGYPLTTSSATYNVKVQDAFNQVWLGQQSPKAAADSVNEESNAAIK
ncbi:multiple sugar transport system substrate-binding protein [Streptomyces achromogenes]|uniref:ABC transporter substrate-binding protein n=1 Tax=Streptomyces achromogenes TaxID=67255 RepID=UPI002780C8DD|nr:sugar ABC transporter substrate-binding protein [Streptomyces achromogenes]MDQ0834581.1 multiple sugar transport system substrate-binding protein [Streptomyces achromogenes]